MMSVAREVRIGLAIAVGIAGPWRGAAGQALEGPDRYLAVRAPEALVWSPDGTKLAAYLANATGGEIRVYRPADGSMTRIVEHLPRTRRYKDKHDLRWSADGTELMYRHGPQYWRVSSNGGTPEPILPADTARREIVVLAPDRSRFSFVRGGDLWVQALGAGPPRRLVRGERFLAGQAEFYGRFAQWTPWSPSGRHLVWIRQTPDSGARLAVTRIADGRTALVPTGGGLWDLYAVHWSPEGERVAVSRLSRDFKRKQLLVYHVDRATAELIREDTDSKFVNHNIDQSMSPAWSPNGRRLAFISNQDGWRRVVVKDLEGGAERTVTDAGSEAWSVVWSPDGERLLVTSNRDSRHSVRIWIVPALGGEARLLTPEPGVVDVAFRGTSPEPTWSPDGSKVGYAFSGPNEPFAIRVAGVAAAERGPTVLYSAAAESLPLEAQATMREVEIPARDGRSIPGVLWHPRKDGLRGPALIYHYGGWGQQARLGWNLGTKARLFQYLVSRGWSVLLADVRGSEGYGKPWAQELYRDAGGRQADDLADAAAWLRARPSVDSGAVAIFGHSYGAYLALTAMLRAPDAFQAGILMAGVFDWSAFSGGTYVSLRWGDNAVAPSVPDLQVRPAHHVDQLRAPVLVYHGTNDFNAPMAFSDQLVRALMRARKDYEYAVYPDEPHDWDQPETERDFLVRTERFLDRAFGRAGRSSAAAQVLDSLVDAYAAKLAADEAALPDLSFGRVEREARAARALLARLETLPDAELDHQQRITRELLAWEAWRAAQDTTLSWYTFPVLPAISPFRLLGPRIAAHPLRTEPDRARYLELLERSAVLLDQKREKMRLQGARGIVLAREQVDNVLPYLRSLGSAATYLPSAARLEAVPIAERAGFLDRVRTLIASRIEPAGRALVEYVDRDVRRAAPDAVGLWQYPGGKEAYRILVRRETTLETSPEEIHDLALRQMDELERRMRAVRDSLGFKGTKADFHERLRKDPQFYVSEPDSVGARFMTYAARLEPVLDRAFARRPRSPYGVKRLDPSLEPSMTYGYYNWATGADPKGYYYFNGSALDQRSLLMAGAIAFHELVPGHHFQINLQRENESLPMFRRRLYHTGYGEGWGEYASSIVAAELGMYRDAYEVYGRLAFDAFFIARLVVDTGMNFYGWPRSRAVAYMREHTLESDAQIDSETLRYSTRQPAQALAYRMGRETFVRLRAKAEAELGSKFDVKRYHDALLMSGPMPLWLLERHIDQWIAAETGRPIS
ncbi:MAG: DUF885 family protein [Gemmatimonadales bacterium]|nr:DUF885 family protein [Gemmatimonadales bacterium]